MSTRTFSVKVERNFPYPDRIIDAVLIDRYHKHDVNDGEICKQQIIDLPSFYPSQSIPGYLSMIRIDKLLQYRWKWKKGRFSMPLVENRTVFSIKVVYTSTITMLFVRVILVPIFTLALRHTHFWISSCFIHYLRLNSMPLNADRQ